MKMCSGFCLRVTKKLIKIYSLITQPHTPVGMEVKSMLVLHTGVRIYCGTAIYTGVCMVILRCKGYTGVCMVILRCKGYTGVCMVVWQCKGYTHTYAYTLSIQILAYMCAHQ